MTQVKDITISWKKKTFTFFGRWSSWSETNSDVPFPALATPFIRAVDTPEPIPKVKHLEELEKV